ncbi:Uncharacterized protein M6B38_247085 [Iris pallida]|uniref:Synergin gamma C-terminal domain-containing protein n=1 Tax=Iris pallida TaxID=29817 RepID=A0AAX6DFS7_IRIPA|nr:Uncharacterized protein M6B38_247085 [Iris pallida]
MPANQQTLSFFSFDDDDDFGEFNFVSSSLPTHQQEEEEDEDWGDFVIGSHNSVPDPNPNPNPTPDSLRKGAIPLSVFGLDEDEPEPEVRLGNGFAAPSPAAGAKEKEKAREVRDLIADLYGQVGVGTEAEAEAEVGEDGWEFKDASSAGGVKELEKKGDAGDNGIEVDGNRLDTAHDSFGQFRVNNGGQQLGDVYAADDMCTNGLNFNSNVARSHRIPDTSQKTGHIENITKLNPSMENGVNVQLWDFDNAFSDNVAVTRSFGGQKIPDAEADLFKSTDKIQDTAILWESSLGFDHASTDNNGKENLTWSVKETGGSFGKPNAGEIGIKDSMFHSVIALDDIISSLYNESDQSHPVLPTQIPTNGGSNIAVISPDSVSLNGDSYFDDSEWEFQKAPDSIEFQKAPDSIVIDPKSSRKIDENLSCGSPHIPSLDLYSRLKEESLFLIVHHLDDLKKAHEVASLSGEQAKALKIDEDIQVIYKKLQEAMVSENMYMGRHQSREACVSQLVHFVEDPCFQAFEQEYHLSKRVLLAEKDFRVAIELFEHATSVLRILELASGEEQQTYINVWSKMGAACAKELQHGAMIWRESLGANISEQILSRGKRYFLALGEIYRVSEILRTSLKLYKPWVLSNWEGTSKELLTSLDNCAEAWTSFALVKSLESISAATTDLEAKALLESITTIRDSNDLYSQNHVFGGSDDMICRLSLLPMGRLKGDKLVTWNGDHYCLKLANLWANRVSSRPPHLPCILAR